MNVEKILQQIGSLEKTYEEPIEKLVISKKFINVLGNKFVIMPLQNTNDFECFVKNVKFCLIYNKKDSQLSNPRYILIQYDNKTHLYELTDDIKYFYDKISTRTVTLFVKDEKYVYSTSNGNEWILQNKDGGELKKYYRADEFEQLKKIYKSMINEDATGGPGGAVTGANVGSGGGGVAYANNSTNGLGPVVSAQPSQYSGTTVEPMFTQGGGTIGSGDVSVPYTTDKKTVITKMKSPFKDKSLKKQKHVHAENKVKKIKSYSQFMADEMAKEVNPVNDKLINTK